MKDFVSVDGHPAIRWGEVTVIQKEQEKEFIASGSRYFIHFLGIDCYWEFENGLKERDKVFNFLMRKYVTVYSSENIIKRKLNELKEKAKERFLQRIKKRKRQFSLECKKRPLQLTYQNHQNIKNKLDKEIVINHKSSKLRDFFIRNLTRSNEYL